MAITFSPPDGIDPSARLMQAAPDGDAGSRAMPGRSRAESHPVVIRALICAYALEYDVEPAFAIAVVHIESRSGDREFRVGKIGRRHYGPMGIDRSFLSKWPIDRLETNIAVGVRALRGVGSSRVRQERRLKRYNASCTPGYLREVRRATERYRAND